MINSDIELEQYIIDHIEDEDSALYNLNRETHATQLYPQMCSGHIQGSILTLISKLVSPKNILEIGTFTGYSSICLAKGLKEGGSLHTIEINDELEEFASKFIEEAGMSNIITQHIGDAKNIVPTLESNFDIVFIDANKRLYSEHYDMIIDKVSPGGVIVADNTLWYGKVADPSSHADSQTGSIVKFNKKVKDDPRVESYIIPIRDGITVLRRV